MKRKLPRTKESDQPKTRNEAIACGAQFYFTGKPCKHGHVSSRFASNGCCAACQKKYNDKLAFPDIGKGTAKLRDIDDALADKALARELKEVWDE